MRSAADHHNAHPYLGGPFPRAFAHRGWHLGDLDGMENSLSAFRRAVAEGYRYLETDVQATTDGVVVVHHDDQLDRTTDGSGTIAALPWSAVRTARIGGLEPVSRLEDALEELPDALFNIDVKADNAVAPVLDTLRRCGALHRVCLASFSEPRLARLRKLAGPAVMSSMAMRSVAALWASGWVPPLGRFARGTLAQVPVRQGPLTVVDRRFLDTVHRGGGEVHVWTIDDPGQMRELLDLGVDGLISDRPDLLREVLRERGQWVSQG